MASWLSALTRTRDAISSKIGQLLGSKKTLSADEAEELEEALIAADIPARLVAELVAELEDDAGGDVAIDTLLAQHFTALQTPSEPFDWQFDSAPRVVLVVGINGSGKTTTSAKLAALAKKQGLTPLLAATDTFRAAGTEQLKLWGERVGCDVVAGVQGADAAAVAYDALDAAVARGADVLLVDTAGRLHTSQPLMEELAKVRRALAKRLPGAPQECWIVLDAALGNNAVTQARMFHQHVPLTGVVIAKLDGSAKAGFALAIEKELGVPIYFTGIGEEIDDLVPYDGGEFLRALCRFTDSEASHGSTANA